ncbi:hypothetical protein MKX03_022751 [Papaver bracteatum]|nr:hypothetical protein MKX03_022751 [Papaver bracteatum]
MLPVPPDDDCIDDDGRVKRTGTLWTAVGHLMAAIMGSGILSLPWAIAQLGWVGGPAVLLLFAGIIYYMSCLLAECYRTVENSRIYSYDDAVRNLGPYSVRFYRITHYIDLFGVAIGCTIASTSMMAIRRRTCFHGRPNFYEHACLGSSTAYLMIFGAAEIIFSQLADQISCLPVIATLSSVIYSLAGILLSIIKVSGSGKIAGSMTGISVSQSEKTWSMLQAVGNTAFAYSFSSSFFEIQDTLKSPPAEARTMKRASGITVFVTSTFYLMSGILGYAALGDATPDNLLFVFTFEDPYWLLDLANILIVIHLFTAFQTFCQPLFTFIEQWASTRWPQNEFINRKFDLPIRGLRNFKLSWFRIFYRSIFVILTTTLSMFFPFFNEVVGILGSIGFWPSTVYIPIRIYLSRKEVPKWMCFTVSLAALSGSAVSFVSSLKEFHPFSFEYDKGQ